MHYLLKFTQKSKKHRTEIVGNDSINYKKTRYFSKTWSKRTAKKKREIERDIPFNSTEKKTEETRTSGRKATH